ncbi:MAG: polyphosphate kinase 2 [Campylobacterales bacterium]
MSKKEAIKKETSKIMKSEKVALIRPEEANPKEAFKKDGKLDKKFYEKELQKLQVELVKLQNWVKEKNKKIIIVFEGRDAAGKGGTIKALTEHLNQRGARVVALGKPSDVEKSQWYFQRYIQELPDGGEIVFFDRSWYNRAGVERVMGFCNTEEYKEFLYQAPNLEQMWLGSGFIIFKYFLDVSKEEQKARLNARKTDPLKRWKLSPIDQKALSLWDEYSEAFGKMLNRTHTPYTPWIVVDSSDKKRARINIARDILAHIDYDGKDAKNTCLLADPSILRIYSRIYDIQDEI